MGPSLLLQLLFFSATASRPASSAAAAFVGSLVPEPTLCRSEAPAALPHHRLRRIRCANERLAAELGDESTVSVRCSDSRADSDHRCQAKPKKERRRRSLPPRWVACASTREMTRAVRMFIQEGDAVAELGSQLRDVSRAICDAVGPNGQVVLADVPRKFPGRAEADARRTSAMRREGDENEVDSVYGDRAEFVNLGDGGFDAWRIALFPRDSAEGNGVRESSFNALVVDVAAVAGNDLDLTSVSIVREFLALNDAAFVGEKDENTDSGRRKCGILLIKSAGLHAWARRLVHAQRLVAGTAPEYIQRHLTLSSSCASSDFAPPVIIAAVGVDEYRRAASLVVRRGDAVLEVGCHVGKTTALLHEMSVSEESGGGCIGADVGPKIVEAAKNRYPDVPFAVADAWRTGDLLRLKRQYFPADGSQQEGRWGYDIVCVDIGGISGSDGLLEAVSLLTALGNALEPKCIIIKSQCMRRLASSLVPFSEVWLQEKREEILQI